MVCIVYALDDDHTIEKVRVANVFVELSLLTGNMYDHNKFI